MRRITISLADLKDECHMLQFASFRGCTVKIVNVTAYRFVALCATQLIELQQVLKKAGDELGVKGTIYLGPEGINLSLAGERKALEQYCARLTAVAEFTGLYFKESLSDFMPFAKMKVKVKKEIIRMDHDEVKPVEKTVAHISPQEFKQWYEQKKQMVVLDTRNDYEFAVGSFDDAVNLNIDTFRQFPEAIKKLPDEYKRKPIVMFCTGGVRCEKAGEFMRQQGFEQVYQLEGGIINYFIENGGAHWHGDCFVFDDRVTIDATLQATRNQSCPHCAGLPAKQAVQCSHCHELRAC